METSLPWFFWAFPLAFSIHNLEEAIWLPAYSKSAGKFHKPVGTFEFVFALVVITLLAVIITLLFFLKGRQSIACYLFFAYNFGMLINVFFPHIIATIALRRYCPGLGTGILLLAPTTIYLLQYGYRNEYILFPTFWLVTIPFAVVVVGSLPLLFRIGRWLQQRLSSARGHSAPR
ncbi:MAG TPA: HXXEE domain-containing protein [Bacteroidota bacterium]|nr:HXXEE domain-containing protein [Bacteroidota bacterium]